METNLKNTAFVNSQVLKYYEKTSKHLFVRNNFSFIKFSIIEKDGKHYIIKYAFNQSKVDVGFYEVNKFLSYSDVSTLLELGKDVSAANVAVRHAKTGDAFQQWQGPYKSIKNFKLMKESIAKADEIIKENLQFYTDASISNLAYRGWNNELETKSLVFLQEIPLNLKK